MKGMIFAAGLGTRLLPLTEKTPKALVEIGGIPMLEIIIKRFIMFGIDRIIINVHHYAEQIIRFLKDHNNFNINIAISDERNFLLYTGGGLKKARWFLDGNEPFLLHNVDVLSDLNLKEMINTHTASGALATVAVRDRPTSRYLLFNKKDNLCGWMNTKTNELISSCDPGKQFKKLAFSGIHIIDPFIFDLLDTRNKFTIIEAYLKLMDKHSIKAYRHDKSLWFDLGSKENLITAGKFISQNKGFII